MSTTKRLICEQAFAELAVAGYVFDLTPEEMQTALTRLDFMLARWEGPGVSLGLGYALPDPLIGSDLDDESGLPDFAVEPVYLNLAVRLAAVFGKQLTPDTKTGAKTGYDALVTRAATPIEQQMPSTLPRGAGNKPWRNGRPFMQAPDASLLNLTQGGDLNVLPE